MGRDSLKGHRYREEPQKDPYADILTGDGRIPFDGVVTLEEMNRVSRLRSERRAAIRLGEILGLLPTSPIPHARTQTKTRRT